MAWKYRCTCLEWPVLAAQSPQRVLGVLNIYKLTVGALAHVPDLWHFLNRGRKEFAGLAACTSRVLHTADVGTVAVLPRTHGMARSLTAAIR